MSELRIHLRDAAGDSLDNAGSAKVSIVAAGSSKIESEAKGSAGATFEFELAPGTYHVRVDADRHESVGKLVSFTDDATVEFRVPISPAEAIAIFPPTAPAALLDVLDFDPFVDAGRAIGDKLAYAGLLNVWAKSSAVLLRVPGSDVRMPQTVLASELITSIFEAKRDRIFVELVPEAEAILELAVEDGVLDHVLASLHDPPREDGYSKDDVISYKSEGPGNLQVTLFRPAPGTELPPLGDVDVDEARGLIHVFHVLEHTLTGDDSHPFEIFEILRSTGVFPAFRLT